MAAWCRCCARPAPPLLRWPRCSPFPAAHPGLHVSLEPGDQHTPGPHLHHGMSVQTRCPQQCITTVWTRAKPLASHTAQDFRTVWQNIMQQHALSAHMQRPAPNCPQFSSDTWQADTPQVQVAAAQNRPQRAPPECPPSPTCAAPACRAAPGAARPVLPRPRQTRKHPQCGPRACKSR